MQWFFFFNRMDIMQNETLEQKFAHDIFQIMGIPKTDNNQFTTMPLP